MFEILSSMRGISFEAIALRMCLAVVCGGIIGLERTSGGGLPASGPTC